MLAKHGITYLVVKLFPAVLSLLSLVIFTHILSPEEYGVYSLSILVAGLGNAVFLQWISLGIGRYLPSAENAQERMNLLATARTLSLCVSLILIGGTLAIWLMGYLGSYGVVLWAVGSLCAIQGWNDLNLRIQNANLNPLDYGKILTLKSVVGFVLGVLSAYLGFGAEGILVSIMLGFASASFLSKNIWRKLPWWFIDKAVLSKLLTYGAPLTITYLLIFVIDASDRFFIERIIGIEAVGIYSAAYEISQYSIGTLAAVVNLAALPLVISAMAKHGVEGAQVQLRKSFLFILAVALPVSGGLCMVAPEVANTLMGSRFSAEAERIIPWIALAIFISAMKSYYFDYAFQLAQSTHVQMFIVFVCAVINIALNFWLIPKYGMLGAAISTVIAFAVALGLSWILGRKVFPMPTLPYKDTAKLFVAFACMIISVGSLSLDVSLLSLAVKVLVGGVVYAIALIIMNMWGCKFILSKLLVSLKMKYKK